MKRSAWAFVLLTLGLSGCGGVAAIGAGAPATTVYESYSTTLPVSATTTLPEVYIDNAAQACQGWAMIWPTIDQATLDNDLMQLTTVASGGPGQVFFNLTEWAQAQLNNGRPTALSDALTVASNDISGTGAQGLPALRTDAEAVNSLC